MPIQSGNAQFETDLMTPDARRGEVWLLDLGAPISHEQGRQRSALVVSSDEWNRQAQVLTFCR